MKSLLLFGSYQKMLKYLKLEFNSSSYFVPWGKSSSSLSSFSFVLEYLLYDKYDKGFKNYI